MGNLVEIKRDYLFNTLAAKDIGVFMSKDDNNADIDKVLFIKKFGVMLHASGEHGYVKSEANAGLPKFAIYKLNSKAPTNPSEYEETITIDPKRKSPGFDELLYLGARTYGGTYNVALAGGIIDVPSLEEIISDIVNQIDSDPGAIVHAGYAAKITGYTAGDNIVLNGTEYSESDLPNLIAAINDGGIADAYRVRDDAGNYKPDEYVVLYKVKFSSIRSDDGSVIDDGYLGVAANKIETSFSPKFINVPNVATDIERGLFPFLTSDDVRRIFVNNGNDGELSMFGSAEHAIPGETYVKYTIWGHSEAYNNQTPGGTLKHKAQFQLFMLKSLVDDILWKSTFDNEEPTGATEDFDALLTYWKG